MNVFLQLWPEVRIGLAGMVGLALGAVVNWAVYHWAYQPRYLSPWSPGHPRDVRSNRADFIPIVGWWRLRRKAASLGRRFWVRPIVVEAACCIGAAAWYWWEVVHAGLLVPRMPAAVLAQDPFFAVALNLQFIAHVLLFGLMLAASLIDADEMNIPDAVTVTGTVAGLCLMTAAPWMLPMVFDFLGGQWDWLHAAAPHPWPAAFRSGRPTSLALGCGCYWFGCFALLPRTWRTRHGYRRALQIFWQRLRREPATKWIAVAAAFGTVLIAIVWNFDALRWAGLLTSLVGMAVGGGVVWIVRLIGGWALRREAMGFGDVTLMGMIGAFVGWQAALMIFFAAPAAAVVIGGLQWLVRRENVLPYGPFLCLSATVVLAAWGHVWEAAWSRFYPWWLLPTVLAVGFLLLFLVLLLLRLVRSGGAEDVADADETATASTHQS